MIALNRYLLTLIPATLVLLCLSVAVTGVLGLSANEIVAKPCPTPTIDGVIGSGEWVTASNVTFNQTTVYVMQNGLELYIAFNISDNTENSQDTCIIFFDVEHDRSSELQADDLELMVSRDGNLTEFKTSWFGPPQNKYFWTATVVSGWTAEVNSSNNLWQVEYNFTYSKINVTAGSTNILGVEFLSYDLASLKSYMWPHTTDLLFNFKPNLWGNMTPNEFDWIPEFSNPWIQVIAFIATLPILFYVRAHKKIHK